EGETCWHGSAINRWNNSAFALKPYDFRGHTVLGPEDFDRYLTENYGNWRVPVTDFHSTDGSGTPNLVLVRNLFIIGLCIKRMVSVDEATRLRLLAMLKDMDDITHGDGWCYNQNFCAISARNETVETRAVHEFS